MHRARMDSSKVALYATFHNFEMREGKIDETICTDEERVMQVLHNFVSNSIKFTMQGEIEVRVELIRQQDDYLKISVRDTGIGIKEQDQHNLFQLFGYIQNTQSMNKKGIGLGLAICKKIVQKFEGEIGVNSRYQEGSTFFFSFKLEKCKV